MKIFGREPALFLNVLAAFLAMAVAVGWLDFSTEQVGLLMMVAAAVVAVGTAYFTHDVTLGVLIGAAEAIFAALLGFGVELSPDLTAAILGVITTLFGFFQRTQTTPDKGWATETNSTLVA